MTIAETNRFYNQDEKKYLIERNKELLNWLKEVIKNGYYLHMELEDLQSMIDNIAYWYEIKYPECELEYYEGIKAYDYKKLAPLSKFMNIEQLIHRLPPLQQRLMYCYYHGQSVYIRDIYDDKMKLIGKRRIICMLLRRKELDAFNINSELIIHADSSSGQVDVNCELEEIVNDEDISLEKLLLLLKEKYKSELDISELEYCIFKHECDLELRKRILQLVSLKLMYASKTTPERGYERAKRYANEFNKKLGLKIDLAEANEIINRDYDVEEKVEELQEEKSGKIKVFFKNQFWNKK